MGGPDFSSSMTIFHPNGSLVGCSKMTNKLVELYFSGLPVTNIGCNVLILIIDPFPPDSY